MSDPPENGPIDPNDPFTPNEELAELKAAEKIDRAVGQGFIPGIKPTEPTPALAAEVAGFSAEGTDCSVKGTGFSVKVAGFSPYIENANSTRALAPEGQSPEDPPENSSFAPVDPNHESWPSSLHEALPRDPAQIEPPLFQSFTQPEIHAPTRLPNFGHLAILGLLVSLALLGTALLTWSALYFHLFGVSTVQRANTDIHYTLGSMVLLYLLSFGGCLLVFPLIWHEGFFAGLQWNAATALHQRWRLFSAAGVCFVLAMADEVLMPGPPNAPIDKLFQSRLAAWLLLVFGVTIAPFFEEIFFRGFLLPALCTAWDWTIEKSTGKPRLPLDAHGHPQWSIFAMVIASILTSIPFALMHAEQIANAFGPLVLLFCVSLILCAARLITRSLAASVLVHASYNLLLFSLMLLGTSGFRHLDKL
jgi:membrane protease YdiL (CAAX protease family)